MDAPPRQALALLCDFKFIEAKLANQELGFVHEFIRGNLEVKRSGSLADTSTVQSKVNSWD
jgi:hypothetical protein